MSMRCFKCHGIIPDVTYDGKDRYDCKNHIKTDIEFDFDGYRRFRSD